jgi:hypothetical protein
MQRKPFDAKTAVDIPPPPEPEVRPPQGMQPQFIRTVSDDTMNTFKQQAKVKAESTKAQRPPAPDWVLYAGEWLVASAVAIYVITCCVYIAIFGMVLSPAVIKRVYYAALIGSAELFALFETIKCVVIAAVQLMVHKSNEHNDVITNRKLRMLEKKQHLEKRQAGMKTMLVQPSGRWLWRRG